MTQNEALARIVNCWNTIHNLLPGLDSPVRKQVLKELNAARDEMRTLKDQYNLSKEQILVAIKQQAAA